MMPTIMFDCRQYAKTANFLRMLAIMLNCYLLLIDF